MAAFAAVFLSFFGCQTGSRGPTEGQLRFQEHLVECTKAVNAADLEEARVHLGRARAKAATPQEHQKVQSLEHLIRGAQALLEGDAAGAGDAWNRIEDESLQDQVRARARAIGVAVPATQANLEVKQ